MDEKDFTKAVEMRGRFVCICVEVYGDLYVSK